MPETTQNRPLMRTVTYGTFQAYYLKREERGERERGRDKGRRKGETEKEKEGKK